MTQRDTVLELLHRYGDAGVTTADFLAAHVPRFSARIEELRKAGYGIKTVRERKGSWRFTLRSTPGSEAASTGVASDPVASDPGGDALFEMPAVRTRSACSGEFIGEAA